jgi:hypothetical protein
LSRQFCAALKIAARNPASFGTRSDGPPVRAGGVGAASKRVHHSVSPSWLFAGIETFSRSSGDSEKSGWNDRRLIPNVGHRGSGES